MAATMVESRKVRRNIIKSKESHFLNTDSRTYTHTRARAHTNSKNVLGCPGLIIGFQVILLLKSILGWLKGGGVGKKKNTYALVLYQGRLPINAHLGKSKLFYICQRERKYLPSSHHSFQRINSFMKFKMGKKPLTQNKCFYFLIFNDQKQTMQ